MSEVEFRRRRPVGPSWPYLSPNGGGPFPTMLDLHGARGTAKTARGGTDGPRLGPAACWWSDRMTLAPEARPGLRSGRNYGVRWLKLESRLVERRPVEDRLWPRRATSPNSSAWRRAMRATTRFRWCGAEHQCDGGLHCDALADQQHVRALSTRRRRSATAWSRTNKTFFNPWNYLRIQPAADTRAPRAGDAGAAADHAGALDDTCARVQEKFAATTRRPAAIASSTCSKQRARVVAKEGADRPRARDGQKFIADQLNT